MCICIKMHQGVKQSTNKSFFFELLDCCKINRANFSTKGFSLHLLLHEEKQTNLAVSFTQRGSALLNPLFGDAGQTYAVMNDAVLQSARCFSADEGLPASHKQLLCNGLKIRREKNGLVLIKINRCCVFILRETWIPFPLFPSPLPSSLSTSLSVLCECRLLSWLPVLLSTSSPSAFQDQNKASRVKSFFQSQSCVSVCVCRPA